MDSSAALTYLLLAIRYSGPLAAGDHAPFFVDLGRVGRGQIIEKLFGRFGVFGFGADKARKAGRRRNRFRQRADHFDARLGDDLADEGEADIDLTIGEHFHRTRAALSEL